MLETRQGSLADDKVILHIASIAPVNSLYEQMFYNISVEEEEQDVFVPCNSEVKGAYKLKRPPADGHNIRLVTSVASGWLPRLLFFPKVKIHFMRLLKSFPVNRIGFTFAHSLLTDGSLAYALFKKDGIPYTVTVQGTDVFFFLRRFFFLRPLARKIIGSAEKVIFLNGATKDALLAWLGGENMAGILNGKAYMLPYGVEDYWIMHAVDIPRKLDPGKGIKCLFVGRLMKIKNLKNILESIIQLNKAGYHATLTIVGPEYDSLNLINTYKQQYHDKINYLGPIYDKDELRRIYREHDIFIMPSLFESFGLVYIEAISQGLPVIYSKGRGIYGIFKEGEVGYGPSPDSLEEIIGSVKEVVNNYTALSQNCIGKASLFGWGRISQEYLKIYKEGRKQDPVKD